MYSTLLHFVLLVIQIEYALTLPLNFIEESLRNLLTKITQLNFIEIGFLFESVKQNFKLSFLLIYSKVNMSGLGIFLVNMWLVPKKRLILLEENCNLIHTTLLNIHRLEKFRYGCTNDVILIKI